jgi:MinD superfamily P-loop ATPase
MIRIAILSGKGGTGKTSVAASFGYLAGKRAVLCDCDVDASNLALVAGAQNIQSREYSGGMVAVIDPEACIGCGACARVCRFDAIEKAGPKYRIEAASCEGCGYCPRVCAFNAISMVERKSGDIFTGQSRFDSAIVYAELSIGAENSGKLSTQVRRLADEIAEEKDAEVIIIDGPPGVSCPAIAAATGTNYILFVSEPTLSGVSDLERAMEMARKLKIAAGVLVNRADINEVLSIKIKEITMQAGSDFWGAIPLSSDFVRAVRNGKTVLEETDDERITSALTQTWRSILERFQKWQ